jgi:hypothetical protein
MLLDNRTLLFMVFRDTPIQSILILMWWFLIIAFAVIFSQFAHNGWGLVKRWRLKRFSYPAERSYEKVRKFPNLLSASVLLTPC